MTEPRPWFVIGTPGRFEPVHWHGFVAFPALMAGGIGGGAAEDALRRTHPVLSALVTFVLGAGFLGLAASVAWRKQGRP